MPEKHTLTFIKIKETPGCAVFSEQPPPGHKEVVGTLYVKKQHAGKAEKVTMELTIG